MNKLENKILSELKNRGISPIKRIIGGHQGNSIFLCHDRNNGDLAVKFGNPEEIVENMSGYLTIENMNAREILPSPLYSLNIANHPVIVMQYLGLNFKESKDLHSIESYHLLIKNMDEIYDSTLKKDNGAGYSFLVDLKDNVFSLINEKIKSRLSDQERRTLDAVSISNEFPNSCFSVFDFTPDNVFIFNGKIKFVDPKSLARGIPIIDLAAFAGCARDVYCLEASREGYQLLKDYSTDSLADKLNISPKNAERLWYFGRGIQSLLGAVFRIDEDAVAADKFLHNSIKYFERAR